MSQPSTVDTDDVAPPIEWVGCSLYQPPLDEVTNAGSDVAAIQPTSTSESRLARWTELVQRGKHRIVVAVGMGVGEATSNQLMRGHGILVDQPAWHRT